ncbi:MAG: HAMP domain-containing sensor histidine kinase, partial [Leptolyngbyaceae bacterium]|nr:HAMP domain-containing sensor histidine kinase [Leptolyngbyaceae bacterium]
IHARAIAHPDQIVQVLSNKRPSIQRPSPEARSSSAPSVPSYLYGSMVHDQTANVQIVLVETLQPLTPQQTLLLEVWIDGLKRSLSLEQEMQRQQAKIALLEQVIQHTAHQVRQPLSLIELYTDVMSSLPVDDPVRSQLDLMRSATTDLDHHIQHLADYGGRTTLQLEPHGLQEIWATSLQQVRPWADEKQIRIVNTSDSLRLMCDRWQMGQVFNNLLLNAIHFSPVGGTITCQWQRFQEEVLVELWDEGPGIDEDDLPKIFMPFHSRRQGGTGIGLSVVKKIVLDHHGQCWATNLPSGGAKFSFTLKC